MSLPFLHVVAGLLVEEGKIFIAQRLESDSSPGKWEFPGGKVEEGETPRSALVREWKEELGVDIEVIRLFGTNRFQTATADLSNAELRGDALNDGDCGVELVAGDEQGLGDSRGHEVSIAAA